MSEGNQGTILVTGGAGYIGSHAVLALKAQGYRVVILDNLVYGHKDLVNRALGVELIVGDTNDRPLLDQIFATHSITAVMHFAAYASWENPSSTRQNTIATILWAP